MSLGRGELMGGAKFIVFEGIDGCGKTTQIQLLAKALQKMGRQALVTAEPTATPTGKMLREALSGAQPRTPYEMAALFALDRVVHNVADGGIGETLAGGTDVLCDRYYYSSLAYQGSLCDFDWVQHMNCSCPAIRHPDLCVFLDIPPKDALARVSARGGAREIYEEENALTLFRNTFLRIFDTVGDPVVIVDAAGTPAEVAARVLAAVTPYL
jgi:dTMP kinase